MLILMIIIQILLLHQLPKVKTLSNNKDILTDNRKAPIVNGCAPPIDGEYLDVKRTYMLRSSTVRKLK